MKIAYLYQYVEHLLLHNRNHHPVITLQGDDELANNVELFNKVMNITKSYNEINS